MVHMHLTKIRIVFQRKVRPPKKNLVQAKLRTELACAELNPPNVSQLWISGNFSKNQHVGPSFS